MASAATQKEIQERMQTVAVQLQKIEDELQSCVEVRQRLDSQLTENEQVKKVRKGGVILTMAFRRRIRRSRRNNRVLISIFQ